jgi:hypothetical protein
MNGIPEFEKVCTYSVKQAVCFRNGIGFVLGENLGVTYPYATWSFKEERNGRREFTNGKFYPSDNANAAARSFKERVDRYQLANPMLLVRYNYLAASEMDAEENCNQIDGIINNTKPSILEHLRTYKPAATENSGGEPEQRSKGER